MIPGYGPRDPMRRSLAGDLFDASPRPDNFWAIMAFLTLWQ